MVLDISASLPTGTRCTISTLAPATKDHLLSIPMAFACLRETHFYEHQHQNLPSRSGSARQAALTMWETKEVSQRVLAHALITHISTTLSNFRIVGMATTLIHPLQLRMWRTRKAMFAEDLVRVRIQSDYPICSWRTSSTSTVSRAKSKQTHSSSLKETIRDSAPMLTSSTVGKTVLFRAYFRLAPNLNGETRMPGPAQASRQVDRPVVASFR